MFSAQLSLENGLLPRLPSQSQGPTVAYWRWPKNLSARPALAGRQVPGGLVMALPNSNPICNNIVCLVRCCSQNSTVRPQSSSLGGFCSVVQGELIARSTESSRSITTRFVARACRVVKDQKMYKTQNLFFFPVHGAMRWCNRDDVQASETTWLLDVFCWLRGNEAFSAPRGPLPPAPPPLTTGCHPPFFPLFFTEEASEVKVNWSTSGVAPFTIKRQR